jgi:uncharacterized membrane protein YjfL (UPF0719 family)
MTELAIGAGQALVYATLAFLFMWIAKRLLDRRMRPLYDADREIAESGSWAISLREGGFYLGIAIGMLGALSGGSESFAFDLLWTAVEGGMVVVFLFVAQAIAGAVVVPGIRNSEAIRDGNVAVALVELGISLATGLVAYGSFAGEGGGLASAAVFFVLGQLALILLTLLYEYITPYDVIAGVRAGNVASGLMLGGILLAFGFILEASLAGSFDGWIQDLGSFAFSASFGIVLVLLLRAPIDALFLPRTTLTEAIETSPNPPAVAVAVSVKIALAIIIGAVLL